MLQQLLERLRLLSDCDRNAIKDFDNWHRLKEDRKLLRLEMELYKAEKENELAKVAEAMDTLDYMEAMMDSFQGGPASTQ